MDERRTVDCRVCGLTKAPRGRSVAAALAGGICTSDCKGFYQEPLSGTLWPGEPDDARVISMRDYERLEHSHARLLAAAKAAELVIRPNRRDMAVRARFPGRDSTPARSRPPERHTAALIAARNWSH
jgi:hypothetical protein